MGCVYSVQRKIEPSSVVKGRIIGINDDIRMGGGGGGAPKYANNLRGGSIKEVSPRGDIIPGFT